MLPNGSRHLLCYLSPKPPFCKGGLSLCSEYQSKTGWSFFVFSRRGSLTSTHCCSMVLKRRATNSSCHLLCYLSPKPPFCKGGLSFRGCTEDREDRRPGESGGGGGPEEQDKRGETRGTRETGGTGGTRGTGTTNIPPHCSWVLKKIPENREVMWRRIKNRGCCFGNVFALPTVYFSQ